jgi:hypothetical protein
VDENDGYSGAWKPCGLTCPCRLGVGRRGEGADTCGGGVGVAMEDRLLSELASHGYAVLDGAVPTEVAAGLGRATSGELLNPSYSDDARPWSLSGVYGLDAFPWHTDAAISVKPPRWLVLTARELSEPTSTEVLRPPKDLLSALQRTVLRCTDSKGRTRYLPAVVPDAARQNRLRWDPRTCSPRSGVSVDDVEASEPTARVAWQEGRVLVIDNAVVLHRRPAVSAKARRSIERIYVWSC